MLLLEGSLQLGLIYGIMALGVYLTFKILNIPDLTADGSFVLGMVVCTVVTIKINPFLGIILGSLSGGLAGFTTGILQTKVGINPVLSSILVMTGLYSINLFIMDGKSNISLINFPTIFNTFGASGIIKTFICILITLICLTIMIVFFKTPLGLSIRATGDNEDMVRSSSINANFIKCIGLAIGNSLVALSGALICHFQYFSDITSGTGIMITALASVIIGEAIFGKKSISIGLISSIVGSVIYRMIIAAAFQFDILPSYFLKLISALIVTLALSLPSIKSKLKS